MLRFREQCDAVDLPLLVGLDFEWKPDKAGSDNPIAARLGLPFRMGQKANHTLKERFSVHAGL